MLADLTRWMYLKSVPLVALSGGALKAALRAAISESLICTSIARVFASIEILSPS